MKTQPPGEQLPHEIYDTAVAYVLGLVDAEQAQVLGKQLAIDDSMRTAVRVAAEDSSLLAESLASVAPPSRVKSRFLSSIGLEPRTDSPHESLGALRSHEGRWRPAKEPGITYKKLYFDKVSGLLTMLVRMEPGTSFAAHRHSRVEQCLVLEGDLIHDEHVYGPGDFTWAEAGTIDPALHTRTGNLLLIIGAPGTDKV